MNRDYVLFYEFGISKFQQMIFLLRLDSSLLCYDFRNTSVLEVSLWLHHLVSYDIQNVNMLSKN